MDKRNTRSSGILPPSDSYESTRDSETTSQEIENRTLGTQTSGSDVYVYKEEFDRFAQRIDKQFDDLRGEIRDLVRGLRGKSKRKGRKVTPEPSSEEDTPRESSASGEEEPNNPPLENVLDYHQRKDLEEKMRIASNERLLRAGYDPVTGQRIPQHRHLEVRDVPRQWTPAENVGRNPTPAQTVHPSVSTTEEQPQFQGNTKIVFDKPEKFDGSDSSELDDFLHGMEWYFRSDPKVFGLATPQGHQYRIIAVQSRLSGIAKVWFIQMDRGLPKPELTYNWEAFVEAINEAFGNPLDAERAMREIQQLRQKGEYRDLQAYTLKFNELSRKSGLEGTAELYAYKQGLQSEIVDALTHHEKRHRDLVSLQRAAYEQYLRIEERKAEKGYFRSHEGRHPSSRTRDGRSGRNHEYRSSSKTETGDADRSREQTRTKESRTLVCPSKKVSFSSTKREGESSKMAVKCFECGGPHYKNECPQRSSLNFVDTTDNESGTGSSSSKSDDDSRGSESNSDSEGSQSGN